MIINFFSHQENTTHMHTQALAHRMTNIKMTNNTPLIRVEIFTITMDYSLIAFTKVEHMRML